MTAHTHHPNLAWPRYHSGARVNGQYYGTAFSGQMWSERQHTIRWEAVELLIHLDQEIEILGRKCNQILVTVCGACGEALDGFCANSAVHLAEFEYECTKATH